jgi:hypothetical protein
MGWLAIADPQLLVTEYVIKALPATTPDTTPPDTAAIAILLLLHVPPAMPALRVTDNPAQTDVLPVMIPAVGMGLTSICVVAAASPQAFVIVYVIVAVPADTPMTLPPAMLATSVLSLRQVPPPEVSLSVIAAPAQTDETPKIALTCGSG